MGRVGAVVGWVLGWVVVLMLMIGLIWFWCVGFGGSVGGVVALFCVVLEC